MGETMEADAYIVEDDEAAYESSLWRDVLEGRMKRGAYPDGARIVPVYRNPEAAIATPNDSVPEPSDTQRGTP